MLPTARNRPMRPPISNAVLTLLVNRDIETWLLSDPRYPGCLPRDTTRGSVCSGLARSRIRRYGLARAVCRAYAGYAGRGTAVLLVMRRVVLKSPGSVAKLSLPPPAKV